jgi:SEC-C motif-containing protein
MKQCYCCSGLAFDMCCRPLIEDVSKPVTAEALMRSRYTAYATMAVAYIIQTTHLSTRRYYDPPSIKAWAASSVWEKLEIISTEKGMSTDTIGYVEFKAYYTDANLRSQIHHEYSTFKKDGDRWFFVDGKVY